MANGPKIAPPSRAARRPRPGMGAALRTNFLTGLVVVAPVLITFYIIWGIITFVDAQIVPLVPEVYNPRTYIEYDIPGFGLFIFVVFTTVVGYFTKNLFGRQIVRSIEGWVDRMPVVRSIYNALKQIVETALSQSASSFQKACLIEYPRKGIWSIAFVATRTSGEIPKRAGTELVSVFLPSTPNPTTGFLLFVPAEDVVLLDMTIEEAAKAVISAGLVLPPSQEEREAAIRRERARKEALAAAAAPKP